MATCVGLTLGPRSIKVTLPVSHAFGPVVAAAGLTFAPVLVALFLEWTSVLGQFFSL